MTNIQIPADESIVVPAKEETTYDKLYIKNFRINTDGEVGKGIVVANLVPFNGTDTRDTPVQSIVINDIFEAMADENRPAELRTLLQNAMGVILQAIVEEKEYQKTLVEVEEKVEEEVVEEIPSE
jgi:hypothetical protein